MGRDKFELLEEYLEEFVNKLDEIGFNILGGNGINGSIELEINEK